MTGKEDLKEVCIGVCDQVMTEHTTQAPGQASFWQRVEGDEDEEECVYMFRYPRGSPKVDRSPSHRKTPLHSSP